MSFHTVKSDNVTCKPKQTPLNSKTNNKCERNDAILDFRFVCMAHTYYILHEITFHSLTAAFFMCILFITLCNSEKTNNQHVHARSIALHQFGLMGYMGLNLKILCRLAFFRITIAPFHFPTDLHKQRRYRWEGNSKTFEKEYFRIFSELFSRIKYVSFWPNPLSSNDIKNRHFWNSFFFSRFGMFFVAQLIHLMTDSDKQDVIER